MSIKYSIVDNSGCENPEIHKNVSKVISYSGTRLGGGSDKFYLTKETLMANKDSGSAKE